MDGAGDMSSDPWGADFLLGKYGENIVGLIGYGSMLYKRTRPGSVYDLWVILRDTAAFHAQNADLYEHALNKPSTVAEQTRLNQGWINYYRITQNGIDMKWAVVAEEDFLRLCRDDWVFVKGRMQKPLKMFRSTEAIDRAIAEARREAARQAVDLLKGPFSFEDFLRKAMSLSYMADIRPECVPLKVAGMIESGGDMLAEIYRPILAEMDYVDESDGLYRDTRDDATQRKAWARTRWYLWKGKFNPKYAKALWRNYHTYKNPLRYVFHKIVAETKRKLNAPRQKSTRLF